jgi:signal transduction histidine kinase/CheY-like chemotaxis protein
MHAELDELAAQLPWVSPRGVSFQACSDDVPQALAEARERAGQVPIGIIVDDEALVLAALAAGADEAALLPVLAPAELAAFVDRLELRGQLRAENQRLHSDFAHAEKLTALGTLVAGVGHEINNPLSAMMLSIAAARRHILPQLETLWEVTRSVRHGETSPEEALAALEQIEQAGRFGRDAARMFDDIGSAGESIASIVRDLRIFARSDQEEPADLVEAQDLIDHAIRLVGREVFQHGLLERDYANDLPKLVLPRNRVTQVIMNVLINAAHAIREVERPVHRVRITARADEDFVAVAISDTGPGIPPESLERIFDPFFTTRRTELGTGLGLAISRAIMRRIGGELAVESVYGSGATFMCLLTRPTREMVRDAWRRASSGPPASTARPSALSVLLVDDDERVLRSYVRLLHPEHRLLIAHEVRDAIELLDSGSAPDVLLLEIDLPITHGGALLDWLAEHRPQLLARTLIVTTAAGTSTYTEVLAAFRGPVLHKPVRADQLLSTITELATGDAAADMA